MLKYAGAKPDTWKDFNIDCYVDDGDVISLGDHWIRVLFTPGHTPGGLNFIFPVHDNGVEHMAGMWGGKLACTRSVFDRGVLPFKLVIGQSGVVVKPKLYISFGVSGAVNHVTGFSDAGTVVAVNTDPDAAIFNYCSYGIVGDMDEVCDAMLAKLGE